MSKFTLLDTFSQDGFYVTQNYGANKAYYAQFNLVGGHEGVDFGHTNKQVMVRTPIGGTAFVGVDKNYGNYTVIENYQQKCAVYICHTLTPIVVSGQTVRAGQQIAEMDDEGNSNGEHIHFNFLILNDEGSNKYRTKACNWGFLDPQYPRDTGNLVKYPGVEDYTVEWVKSVTTEPMPEITHTEAQYQELKHENQDNWEKWQASKTEFDQFKSTMAQRLEVLAKNLGVVIDWDAVLNASARYDQILNEADSYKDKYEREVQAHKVTVEKDAGVLQSLTTRIDQMEADHAKEIQRLRDTIDEAVADYVKHKDEFEAYQKTNSWVKKLTQIIFGKGKE